jgi:hypothetical protein
MHVRLRQPLQSQERQLWREFGPDWVRYKSQVRRWLWRFGVATDSFGRECRNPRSPNDYLVKRRIKLAEKTMRY